MKIQELNFNILKSYLVIQGIASPKTYKKIKKGFSVEPNENTICVFISYAYDSIFIEHKFDCVFRNTNVFEGAEMVSIIKGVTQQFVKPLECIPEGWKTICLVEFPVGVPELIQGLPTVDNWFESDFDSQVCLSNKYAWEALKTTGYENLPEFWKDYNIEKQRQSET